MVDNCRGRAQPPSVKTGALPRRLHPSLNFSPKVLLVRFRHAFDVYANLSSLVFEVARLTSRVQFIVYQSMDVVGAVVGSLSFVAPLLQRAQNVLSLLLDNKHEQTKWLPQDLDRDLRLIRSKLTEWQKKWADNKQPHDVNLEILWGTQGWENVKNILQEIDSQVGNLQRLQDVWNERKTPKARYKWIRASSSPRLSTKTMKQNLASVVESLSLVVDHLWLYTETVFRSRYGQMSQTPRVVVHTEKLKAALQSRSGSLELYWTSSEYFMPCSLGLDLFADLKDSNDVARPFAEWPTYQLFVSSHEDRKALERCSVEELPGDQDQEKPFAEGTEEVVSKLPIFEKLPADFVVQPVDETGSKYQTRLQLRKRAAKKSVHLKSAPRRLSELLKALKPPPRLTSCGMHRTTSQESAVSRDQEHHKSDDQESRKRHKQDSRPETNEHLSVGAKVALAFNLVESALFLLGTPWFSSLGSRHILRLEPTLSEKKERDNFMLEIQTIRLEDLTSEDADALAETSQLYRLGVLLIEIALDGAVTDTSSEDTSSDADISKQLPQVEKAMGAQYCRATAFCLQRQEIKTRFHRPSKYDRDQFKRWEEYLEDFLQGFYTQVFSELEELRKIDPMLELRSRKSWDPAIDTSSG